MKVATRPLKYFLLSVLCFAASLSAGYTVVEDQMSETIKTPSLDNVQRMKIRLDNGLEALLVSDPETPKSGAALSVGVGQTEEPFDQVGLAHFCEHMLFMGTAEYPIEKEYHEFIDQNGGSSNAYTSTNQTVYMYEINNDKMSEALKRFGSFFNNPLFNESGLSREMQAVDNEFTFRANMDGVRNFLVMLEMTRPEHPLHTWRCGTKETLSNISRDELVEWYQSHYGANKMKLAIYSSQPMNEILAQVDEIFSPVKTNESSAPKFSAPLVAPESLGKIIYMEPIKDVRELTVQWEVPSEYAKDLDYHTMNLVGAALAEEYSNSLATYLKTQGLVQSFSAGGYSIEDNVALFQISMDLTEKGVYNVDTILSHCFETLGSFEKKGIPRYRFDEMVSMAKLDYQYQSRPKVVSFLADAAATMRDESLESYPQNNMWPSKFSQERNIAFLKGLKPQNAFYCVMVPNTFLNKDLDRKEKLTGAKYCVESIEGEQLSAWASLPQNPEIGIAPPNPYIPDDLNLVQANPSVCDVTNPTCIAQNERATVYFAGDNRYQVPEAYYSVLLNCKQIDTSVKTRILLDVYMASMQDALSSLSDQGSLAGIGYNLGYDDNFGLALKVRGYSQKASLYLKEVLEKMKDHRASQGDFLRYKEGLTSLYENMAYKQMPVQHAATLVQSILNRDFVPYDQKLQAVGSVTYEDYQAFVTTLYDQVYVRGMLYGNLDQSSALEVSDFLEASFADSQVYPLADQHRKSILKMDEMTSPHLISESTQIEGNAALLAIGQGEKDLKKGAALKVYAKAVSTPFFDTLRTKQQTGYMVNSMAFESEKQLFTYFYVLTNSHAPRDLLARFELFNEDFLKVIGTEEFDQEKFEAIKGAIVTEIKMPPNDLVTQGSELSALAFDHSGDFNRRANLIASLNELTFEEFAEFSQEYFGRRNPRRIAALVEGVIAPENALDYISIQNISNFKSQLYYTSADTLIEEKDKPLNEI